MGLKESLTAGIEAYTGRKVKTIKIHPDPVVSGTYAIRVDLEGKGTPTADFLIVSNYMEKPITRSTPEEIADNLEEAMYETWPPKSGPVRFGGMIYRG